MTTMVTKIYRALIIRHNKSTLASANPKQGLYIELTEKTKAQRRI